MIVFAPILMMVNLVMNTLTLIAFYVGVGTGLIFPLFDERVPEQASLPVEEVVIDDIPLQLWVATTDEQQRLGLSGVEQEDMQFTYGADGMLFVFSESDILQFWMHGMEFDLDVLWIVDDKVVKIDEAIPAPGNAGGETVEMSSDPLEVDMVLELPAGSVADLGIEVGDTLTK